MRAQHAMRPHRIRITNHQLLRDLPLSGTSYPNRGKSGTLAMIIRYALFEGEIHPGRESEFRRFVRERLVPLWTQFPGAKEVRVLDGTARDDGAPVYAMALAIRYPDMDTCNRALQSDARFQSREVTGELLKMFTGRVHHHVFESNEYAPARSGS